MAEGSTAAVEKAPGAFRTISEVAQELEVPQHVLRFWESRFREIRPMKRGGGRRYYRPDDLDLLRGIRHLLYGEGYTIRGVQRLLREQGVRFVQNVWQPGAPQPARQTAEQDEGIEQASADDADALPFSTLRDVGDERVQRSHAQPAAGVTSAAPAGLAAEEVQKLRAAVQELTECRRLLEAALREKI
jgi:DNA-binding transcriptional MerR regulator